MVDLDRIPTICCAMALAFPFENSTVSRRLDRVDEMRSVYIAVPQEFVISGQKKRFG